jgi:uncharacterized protein (DUF2062 family)
MTAATASASAPSDRSDMRPCMSVREECRQAREPVATQTTEKPTWWRRRILAPLGALLAQGTTPAQLARTVALGTVCSLFPFLGTTSVLNLVAGLALRMNQPLLQTLNQVLGPVQLAMILVYVRAGEWLWGATGDGRFSVGAMIGAFSELSFTEFLAQFGRAGLHAFTAWALTAPLLFVLVWLPLRPVLARLARSPASPEDAP